MLTLIRNLFARFGARGLSGFALFCAALPVSAAVSSISIVLVNPASGSGNSGTEFQYQINYTCSPSVPAVPGETSCNNMVIRVPLGTPVSNPAGATVADWVRNVTLLPPGATSSMSGTDLLITLPPAVSANGQSTTFQLSLRPTDYVTLNNTSWSLAPSISGSNIATATAAPVSATALASSQVVLRKDSLSGNVATIGDQVTYRITGYCQGLDSFSGHLALQSFDLVDTLPNTVTYISSSPAATFNAGARTLTWTNMPARCTVPDTNHFYYDVTVRINDTAPMVPNLGSLVNPVQSHYRTISDAADRTASAQHQMTIYHGAPPVGNIIGKQARGILNATNNTAFGTPTYAGHWLPEAPTPSIWGQAEASFRLNISTPPVGYSSELVDPMPCLDNYVSTATSGTYSSKPLPATTTNLSAIPPTELCQNPAFHPIRFSISPRYYDSASTTGIRAAYASGWRPAAILKDGTRVDLALESEQSSFYNGSMWFAIPAANREQVAMLHLPHHAQLQGMELGVHGYADPQTDDNITASRTAIRINNTAYARMHWREAPTFSQSSASSYFTVIGPSVQLQMDKLMSMFYVTDTSTGKNYTPIRLFAYVTTPTTLTSDVIVSDLLPEGMSLSGYPGSTVPFSVLNVATNVSQSGGAAPMETFPNYLGTGRELVRITIPGATFAPGSYRISFNGAQPPGPLVSQSTEYNLPIWLFAESPIGIGTYTNSSNIYAPDASLLPICQAGNPNPSPPLTSDPLNQSGRGVDIPYCQSTSSFTRSGQGAAGYMLNKQVQGDLDLAYQPPGTAGHISLTGGTARYRLTWTNTGGQALNDVVVYDILPEVGDTSTISGNARGSQYRVALAGLVTPLPFGMTAEYSASSNPCRPEVYAGQPPGCVNDWTPNSGNLGGIANVKALRFRSSQTYGSGQSFTLEMNVVAPAVSRGQIANNNAASRASQPAGALLPAESPIVALRGTDDGQLRIGKTVDQATARSGDTLTYTVTVSNTGPLPALGVAVSDSLPEHTSFVSATGNGVHDAAATGGNITWTIDLGPGASTSFTVVATVQSSVPAASTLTNSVGLTNPATGPFLPPVVDQACPEPLANRSCASTRVPTAAHITLSKQGSAIVGPGRAITYSIALGNSGETASGTALTVTELLPAGVTAQTVVPGNNVQSVSCLPALPQTGTALTCTLTLAAPLAAGSANGAASIQVKAFAPQRDGQVVNYASVDPTGGTTPPAPGPTCAPEASCGSATTQVTTSKLEPIPTSSPWALVLMGLALGWAGHYENRRRRRQR